MEKYAFIIPITKTYLEKGKVLLNSIAKNSNVKNVFVLSHDLDKLDFIEFSNDLNLTFVQSQYHPTEEQNKDFRMIRTYRFKYAEELGRIGYMSICLLDADMVMLRDLTKFFIMAEAGVILVSNNNTILKYTPEHFAKYGIDCNKVIIHPTFCTVPLFINPQKYDFFLNAVWDYPSGNDLEIPNLLITSMGLSDNIHYLNSYCWTNIHHTMLKPETGVKGTSQGLFSGQGEPIWMLHGHLGEDKYVNELINPMIKNYKQVPKAVEHAKNAIRNIKNEFDKYTRQSCHV